MSNFLALTFLGILAIGNHPSDCGQVVSEFQPEFVEPLENLTVPVGRDATFRCHVRNLAGYRVGWVRADTKAIQAIHTHVITHNPRVSVSHSDHSYWHLHIKGVKEEDRGMFMCQINTDPMISQIAFLEVVIPPDFIPEETSSDVMAPEGSSVKLQCKARGHPEPAILWRREGGQNITLKPIGGSKTQVAVYESPILRLEKITRDQMGSYLCIASNGVPPSISKRIMVSVNFNPVIQVPNQLIGSPLNTDVSLECNVEAYPRSIHFWMKDDGMVITQNRFEVQEIVKSMFEVKMILTIRDFQREDAGTYKCVAKNSLGDVDSVVKLHAIKVPQGSTEGPYRSNRMESATLYDEDSYYDSMDPLVRNKGGESPTSRFGTEGKNARQGHQNRISGSLTPGGGGREANNKLANNNINNGRPSRKSHSNSNGSNNNAVGKNWDRDTNIANANDNTRFQKTVVVKYDHDGPSGKGVSQGLRCSHGMQMSLIFVSGYIFFWHLHFLEL